MPMEIDEWAIGQRIASHRSRRGLTQDELAELVGISLSMMKKIESGNRAVTRFSQLVLFAQVLRIKDLRELTGVPLPLMPDGHRGHPSAEAVYSALMDRGPLDAETPNLTELASASERAWQTWQEASAFRYDLVGQQLPGLIRAGQSALSQLTGEERRRALRLTSKIYQLTRTWTKRVGEHELSFVSANRASHLPPRRCSMLRAQEQRRRGRPHDSTHASRVARGTSLQRYRSGNAAPASRPGQASDRVRSSAAARCSELARLVRPAVVAPGTPLVSPTRGD